MPIPADYLIGIIMTRAITVKVATPKVIAALQAKLEKVEKDFAEQEKHEANYQKSMEAWRKSIQQYALENIKKAENFRTNYRSWNNSLNVDFDLTVKESEIVKEPTREYEVIHSHTYKEMVEDITNALNILKMTDEETVNASTMKSIAKYL